MIHMKTRSTWCWEEWGVLNEPGNTCVDGSCFGVGITEQRDAGLAVVQVGVGGVVALAQGTVGSSHRQAAIVG